MINETEHAYTVHTQYMNYTFKLLMVNMAVEISGSQS